MAPLETSGDPGTGVAIVGMAGRFPGSADVEAFWRSLQEGRESITFFSDDELRAMGVEPALWESPDYVKARGVLAGAELFDAGFFGLSPREAELMDPQQRVFLEIAWTALEHAGYDPGSYPGAIGVYAGAGWTSYLLFNLASHPDLLDSVKGHQTLLANDKDNLATRVSYKLNLRGPSLTIQTACSTSLVAVASAYHALLGYQCDLALAGGVSISFPQAGYVYRSGGIFSPDGHCRAFDARAGGTVLGSGAGVAVLKRLEDALADGDTIHAVIKSAAVNNDGAAKAGYTAPSVDGQAAAIIEAHLAAGVTADTITYVEAHGTGTTVGDPIEIAALTKAFRASTGAKSFCALGSAKTNIGHLDAAAGVAGLIKTTLALEHGKLPPSLHFTAPNPQIDFASGPFYVNTSLSEWRTTGAPRRAGVSSFGLGGTNAHVVLEEAPRPAARTAADSPQLLVLSARSGEALERATENLARHLREHRELDLADVAYTLQAGRRAFAHRRVLSCASAGEALEALGARDPERILTHVAEPAASGVAFLFSGQGAQSVDMARGLYLSEPAFREPADACFDLLRARHGLDLRPIIYPGEERRGAAAELLKRTEHAQPALYAVEYALARMWMAWGIQMKAAIGHSLGEYVAATLAGVFSLEDALALVAERGRLMQALPGGAMLAVPLPEQEVSPLLRPGLSLAAVNAPRACVVSGPPEAVEELRARLAERGAGGTYLETSHAFHSGMMDPVLAPFEERLRQVRFAPPSAPFISNVTGTWVTAAEATSPQYWVQHLRQPVRFAQGLEELLKDAQRVLLEVGPGRTLSQLALRHPGRGGAQVVLSSLPGRKDATPDRRFALKTLGQLWLSGLEVDWPGVHRGSRPRRVPLPTYPFERQRYWIEPAGRQRSLAEGPRPGEALWTALADGARSQAQEELARFDERERRLDDACLDEACLGYMSLALRQLGAFQEAGEAHAREGLLALCGVIPRYEQLFSRWLRWLVEAGLLRQDEAGLYRDLRPSSAESVRALAQKAAARWERSPRVVELVRGCGEALKDVVRGARAPLELFASVLEGSAEKAQTELGQHTHYRAILRGGVERVVQRLPPAAKLRVLEIGGGTGIATSVLLPALPAGRTEYTFTDVAPLFLSQARAKFGAFPFVRYAPLDIERPPDQQGLPGEAFDVVVAVNVLHAARDIHAALRHARSLLAPGGLLLVGELTRPVPDFAVTYGLMMNPVEDPERDQGQPFLSPDRWRAVLEASGFARAASVPDADVLGQHVLLAQAPEPRPGQAAAPAFTAPAPSPAGSEPAPRPHAGLTKRADIADWFHVPSWKRSPLPRRAADPGQPAASPPWLLFADELGVAGALEERLRQRGHAAVIVKAGEGFRRQGPDRFEIHPERPEDYEALLRALREQGTPPARLVHLWSVLPPVDAEPLREAGPLPAPVQRAFARGLGSLILLAKAFGAQDVTDPVRLWVVSSDMQEVLGEAAAPEKATLLAPCRVIPLEYPNVQCSSVDIALAGRGAREEADPAGQILEEILSGSAEPVVAYRGPHRWVRSLEPVRLDAPAQPLDRLKERGVYLLTGGLGKIGLTLAEHLARTVRARLVLTRRSWFPEPREWDAWLGSHPEDDQTSRALRALRALEALGSEVLVVSADVADLEQMRAAVALATRRFGPIDGVIHSAGVLGDGAIQHKSMEELARVLSPKVRGTLVLDALFGDQPLDFFVLFSSLSAVEPGFGQVAYSAANNFLDAFARGRLARRHRSVACISWDVWRGEGMAYDARAPLALQKMKEEDFDRRGLLPHEGVEAFRRALSSRLPHVLVSASNYLDVLKERGRDLSQLYLEALGGSQASLPRHARPKLGNAYEPPRGESEEALAAICQELLGIDRVGATDDFFELGGDSLIGTQLTSRIQKAFGVTLSMKALYANPTVRSMSAAIDQALLEQAGAEKLSELLEKLEDEG